MTRTRQQARAIVACAIVLAVGVAGWYMAFHRAPLPTPEPPDDADDVAPDPPPPDPRLTFPTPFRNVKPDVAYVGDASCAGCHGDVCTAYHAHPMGRSAAPVGRETPLEKYAPDEPVTIGVYDLRVVRTADRVVQRLSAKDAGGAPLPEYVLSADIVIGSGTRGRSYLWVEGGAAWQSPVGWFTTEARWKLFPGFHPQTGGAWPVHTDCLFCHVDRVEPVPRSLNRYRVPLFPHQAAIGCERCHGPGALHVAERAKGAPPDKIDTSVVNPRHLPPDLRAAVCEQCHLQGQERVARRGRDAFEFRPGLPFEQFVTVFVRHPDLADARHGGGQFEQMEQSRCFAASAGRLGCTSCHDPHSTPAPAARDGFYRGRCLACHGSKGCSARPADRAANGDSCTACHMPRGDSSNVAHVSVTDHRVLRRPGPPGPGRGLPPGAVPLVAFRTGPHAPPPDERERDLGLVLARLTTKIPPAARTVREHVAGLAIDRLTAALAARRGDAGAWTALATARGARGEAPGRSAAAATAVRLAPDSEPALAEAAEAALAAGEFDRALDAAAALVRLNPSATEYRFFRAIALVRKKEWGRADEELRAILASNPLHQEARFWSAVCRHRLGDVAGGRREAETAAGLVPDVRQREDLRERYLRETR